jgi:cardiolipin synthase
MPGGIWPVTIIVFDLAIRLALICFILLRRRTTASTLAWIVVVMAVPMIGAILYLLIGEVRLGRNRVRRHLEIIKRIQGSVQFRAAASAALNPSIPSMHQPIAALAQAVGDNDALGGNIVRLLGETDMVIQSLVEDIDHAQFHCHLLFYIYLDDHSGRRVAEALMRAAKRGVECRVLVDAVGSKIFARSNLRSQMQRAGVRVVEALPVHPIRMLFSRLDLRNHRKLAVIDGAIGYTGSQNIADAEFAIKPRFAPWVDAMARVEGPVTWDLQILFVEDWYLDTDESLDNLLNIQPLAIPDGMTA